MNTQSVDIEIPEPTHIVTLEVFECKTCSGALGVDLSYLDQQSCLIVCPYCSAINEVAPDEETVRKDFSDWDRNPFDGRGKPNKLKGQFQPFLFKNRVRMY
jgi:hypothetical protein